MERGKKARVRELIRNKINFKTKAIVRDKEEHYIMIKGTIKQEDITLEKMYVPNIGTSKYVKLLLMDIKGEINRNIVIVRDFNTPLISMHTSSRQKVNEEKVVLNNTLDQMGLIDIFRAFYPKAAEVHILVKCKQNIS